MTPILAKVLAVDKQGDQYRAIIQITLRDYRGSFNTLSFGEKKPSLGSYPTEIPALKRGSRSRSGRLCDLVMQSP